MGDSCITWVSDGIFSRPIFLLIFNDCELWILNDYWSFCQCLTTTTSQRSFFLVFVIISRKHGWSRYKLQIAYQFSQRRQEYDIVHTYLLDMYVYVVSKRYMYVIHNLPRTWTYTLEKLLYVSSYLVYNKDGRVTHLSSIISTYLRTYVRIA